MLIAVEKRKKDKEKNIELDRKILAQIALENPKAFEALVKKII